MKKPIRVVFFDLGNTLLYDKEPWEKLYQEADDVLWKSLHTFGVQASPAEIYGDHETLFHYYYNLRQNELDEPGIGAILKSLLKRKGVAVSREQLYAALRSMYKVTQANWYLEDDAIPTLQTLKEHGFQLGLISNGADDENTQTLIDKARLRPFFEYIISSAAFGKRKPHPSIFRAALNHFRVRAEETVMVGDTFEADIVGAQRVGMNTIWITRRVREPVADSGVRPDAVVKSLNEIPALLSA